MKWSNIKDTIKYFWYSFYSLIISSILTGILFYITRKYNFYLWKSEFYSDMLTAVITFLSIIISVFGILIPSVMSAREEKKSVADYFFTNANVVYFVKCIKRTMLSGFVAILLVCVLYLYDMLPEKLYVGIWGITIFFVFYFCCSSYRFIGILLSLLYAGNKSFDGAGKKYSHKVNEEEKRRIDEMLRNKK